MPPSSLRARPTTYNGIEMRSRLEAKYAQWLDGISATWEYEPQCFADERGQYLPDFLVHDILILGSPRELYVEVKPVRLTRAELCELIGDPGDPGWNGGRMGAIWSSRPEAFIALEIAEFPGPVVQFPPAYNAGRGMAAQWGRDIGGALSLHHSIARKWADSAMPTSKRDPRAF